MRKAILALTVLATVALSGPVAAQAHPNGDDGLRVRLQLPASFSDPTLECPAGIADFGISSIGRIGSGRNCILAFVPADCPPAVVALFCQKVPLRTTLRLPGGRIEADATIFEIWTCGDPNCTTLSVDEQWSGKVTRARGRFDELQGASVSGGGTAVFDAATFEILSLDETLVIGEADEGGD